MSDHNTPKGAGGKNQGWTEHEVLVYLLSAMESGNLQIDFNAAPVPAGRNVNGCRQKINKIKTALKPEMDALKAGVPIASPTDGTPTKKPVTPRKRKAKTDDEGGDGEITPKKGRRRPKEAPTPKIEDDQEHQSIKAEAKEDDDDKDDILEEAEDI